MTSAPRKANWPLVNGLASTRDTSRTLIPLNGRLSGMFNIPSLFEKFAPHLPASIDAPAGDFDNLGPFHHVVPYIGSEFLGGIPAGIHAIAREPGQNIRLPHDFSDSLLKLDDNLARSLGRGKQS